MNYFDLQCAINFHDDMLSEIGGLNGYNKVQIGYLDSALEQIQNDDYYPTFFDKMAHIIFSCVKFHPFLDGNKRTSIYLGCHFAKINGLGNFYLCSQARLVCYKPLRLLARWLSRRARHALLARLRCIVGFRLAHRL